LPAPTGDKKPFAREIPEDVSLLRIELHSWQKLKGSRLEHVIVVLEERIACLSRLSD
jgi:hypothetical protein